MLLRELGERGHATDAVEARWRFCAIRNADSAHRIVAARHRNTGGEVIYPYPVGGVARAATIELQKDAVVRYRVTKNVLLVTAKNI